MQNFSPIKRCIQSLSKQIHVQIGYTNSQLPAIFNNYFKLITDVHAYNKRQIKTLQFALPKARLNSGAKMIKYSVI